MKSMKKDAAVSPVVGVMLMLVVTIVIAAVVAAFAGGISTDEQVAPNVKFDVSYKAAISDADKTNNVPDYGTSASQNNGFTFRLVSGDSVELKNLKVTLTSAGQTATFGPTTIQTTDAAISAVKPEIINIRSTDSANPDTTRTYFAVPSGMDYVISAGETFTLLCDGYYDNSESADAVKKGRFLLWQPNGGGKFTVQTQVPVTYTVFDTVTGKQIQTGTVTIK